MTASNAQGILQITCDACPVTYHQTAGASEFRKLVELARADRSSIEKHAGTWQHVCPACTKARKGGRLL